MRCYQENINQPTQVLAPRMLESLTKSSATHMAIDAYRDFKKKMAEAEARQELEKFVSEVTQMQEYKDWLSPELKKDERRRKKLMPEDDLHRVKLFIKQKKNGLAAVIPTANFTESTDKWGRKGLWRVQSNGYLTGLAVLDADHVSNPEELIKQWLAREDFKELGIVWIFITPSGEGVKVVFKANLEWGNLQDNAYQMAEKLGVLEYADSQCKNSDHAHFVPRFEDIKFIDWKELFDYFNPEFEKRYGEAYRRGESEPTQPRWQEFERKSRTSDVSVEKKPESTEQASSGQIEFSSREQAIIKALNAFYGKELGEGKKHPTFCQQTAHWLLWLLDNNPERAIALAYQLDYVKNWQPQPGEVEDLVRSAASKKLLKSTPKALKEILEKAGIDTEDASDATENPENGLAMEEWAAAIEKLFDIYPCLREVCEPHPRRLWPFLFFASSALFGSLMTLTYYYYYDNPEKKRRLNYNVLGIGDPASGKGALVRVAELLTEPIVQADQLANDAINAWKEEQRSKGSNKDKSPKPKGVVRLHGARTSNNVFINDMVNAWTEIDGERIQMHMLTVDTEALNSIKMQKGGSWIDKGIMEIKAWSNEVDSQQYANLDSISGSFNVYWNLVRTCTPPALKTLANERNFGSGWPTRVSAIPVPGTGFQMLELRRQSQKAIEADEVLRQYAYKLDKRQGELPLWPLVEHAWHWADGRMEIAKFNSDKADELLLKRCPANALAIVAPWVDMRHEDKREKTGTYEVDEQDKALLDLALDIQYRTTTYWFGALARNYFEEQTKDATLFRRRTTRFEHCYAQLPEVFTTEKFAQVFGYASSNSAAKTIERFLNDKVIVRTKRGEYRKRVQSLS